MVPMRHRDAAPASRPVLKGESLISPVPLTAEYRYAASRMVTPEQTLERIQPLLAACGISRYADITGLDRLGVPVFCAIRPASGVQQVTNGKGMTSCAALVSALMEGIELHHVETAPVEMISSQTFADLRESGATLAWPDTVAEPASHIRQMPIEWVRAETLDEGYPILVPADRVFFDRVHGFTAPDTNGLASGNHIVEATLHGLYELIERDAFSRLMSGRTGTLLNAPSSQGRARVVELSSLPSGPLSELRDRIAQAKSQLSLYYLDSCVPVHTFWAVLADESSNVTGSAFNMGWGTHSHPEVAAVRAITEAAQTRATLIHGGREDCALNSTLYRSAHDSKTSDIVRTFAKKRRGEVWNVLIDTAEEYSADLNEELDRLLKRLRLAGYDTVARIDLSRAELGIPVVKVVVPGLQFDARRFG